MKPRIVTFGNQHMNLGHGIAADLALAGYEVAILDRPEFEAKLAPIRAQGGIHVTGNTEALTSGKTGFARIDAVTTDPKILQDVDVLFVDVPANEFEAQLEPIAPHIKDGAILHFNYYGYWPSLRVARILEEAGKKDVVVTECPTSFYYAGGKDGHLDFAMMKQGIPLSVFPAKKSRETFALLKSLYPTFVPAQNILETNFMNLNMIWHANIALLNVGYFDRVEAAGEMMHFYGKGITKHTGILAEAQDREREAVCQAYGVPYTCLRDLITQFSGGSGETIAEAQRSSGFVQKNMAYPVDLWVKWIEWDMPLAMVPFVSLADLAGIPMPIHRGLIDVLGAILETDFWETGATLDKLGLSNLSPEQIIQYVTEGKRV